MPTIQENKSTWDGDYTWGDGGEEWSQVWGTSAMQWHGTLLPRIQSLLPAESILEIAPGYGRWTRFLKDHCDHLTAVDLSEKCIAACKQRFADFPQVSCVVNDGKSLDAVPDQSIDLIFSFDSLVHAEDSVIEAYVSQFAAKLKPNGVAVIHHSNLGEYAKQIRLQSRLARIPILLEWLKKIGTIDDVRSQWRAPSMTAEKMRLYATKNGLHCISQELITWNTRRSTIDCISLISRNDSDHYKDPVCRIFRNQRFMDEARYLGSLAPLYSPAASADSDRQ